MELNDSQFCFYAYTRFKLKVSAGDCFDEVKQVHGDQAPGKSAQLKNTGPHF